jgi:hypothetical protein
MTTPPEALTTAAHSRLVRADSRHWLPTLPAASVDAVVTDPPFTSQEWYTPACVLDRVIELFGEIDLDPCSNSHEHPWVPALRHLTKEDDALAQSWSGKVFVNPTFHDAEKFVRKLLDEFASGRVTEALLLVRSSTDTKWASLLRDVPRCHVTGRLKFVPSEGTPKKNGATFGSSIFYLGPDLDRFNEVFAKGPGRLGDVFVRVK